MKVGGKRAVINEVKLTKGAQKDLKKVPHHIRANFDLWVLTVRTTGLAEARKVKGYHDHPLHGDREGQRAVSLSYHWRAVYTEQKDGTIQFIQVEEVHKHDY